MFGGHAPWCCSTQLAGRPRQVHRTFLAGLGCPWGENMGGVLCCKGLRQGAGRTRARPSHLLCLFCGLCGSDLFLPATETLTMPVPRRQHVVLPWHIRAPA